MTSLALVAALAFAAPPDKPPTTLDEKIAAALKSHPDVKAAEAKRLLADAELEQARLVITQKVTAAATKVELAKLKVVLAEEDVRIGERILKLGNAVAETEKLQYGKAVPTLASAKAELMAAESELQQLVGKASSAEAKPVGPPDNPKGEAFAPKMPSGPAIDKLEAAVQKTVKFELKNVAFQDALSAILKASGSDDVLVRGGPPKSSNPVTFGGDLAFGAAVEMLTDEFYLGNKVLGRYQVFVREYGLLVETPEAAPKDAPTLSEFVRAVRAKKK